MRVRKGDLVEVIAGKDRGRQGKVLAALPKKEKVIVEGVNRVKKHTKVSQTRRGAKTGGIETKEAPINASNVMVVDPDEKKPTRVGYRRDGEGRPIRFSRRTGKDF